ncbi:transcription initiation factor TAFII31, partial [Piptocephalis cylindrospora]
PKELTAINLHLNSHPDVPAYAPAVAQQLAEMAHRHVHDILQDALLYTEHAGRTEPDLASVRLAAQARQRYTWVEPNPAEFTAELARDVNARPLPKIEDRIGGGVRLPPESDCLTGRSLVLIPDV